jgi:hypothetical protein
MTKKNVTDQLRARFTEDLAEFLAQKYDTDVCRTAAGTLMIPAVDSEGDDRWIKFSVIIPKDADEESGTDGYSLAHEYDLKLEAAAARKEKAAKKSAAAKEKAAEKTSA